MSLDLQLMPPIMPAPIPWWPPAPGWWLLMGLGLLLGLTLPLLARWLRLRRLRRQRAQLLLENIPDGLTDRDWLTALNTLLKRVAKHQGASSATRLHGEAWLDYLCTSYPKPQREALAPLASGLYQRAPDLTLDQRARLRRELRRWLHHNHV